jgi:hypothetical protein
VTRLTRPLEALTAGVALVLVAMLATGGWTVGGLSLTRADELVILLAAIVALRALVARCPRSSRRALWRPASSCTRS